MLLEKDIENKLIVIQLYENDKKTLTGLDGFLKQNNIKKVYLCGLALDFCVYYSAIDATNLGYETYVILNATKELI